MIKEYFEPAVTDRIDELLAEYEENDPYVQPQQLIFDADGTATFFINYGRIIVQGNLPTVDEICPPYNRNQPAIYVPINPWKEKLLEVKPIPCGIGWKVHCIGYKGNTQPRGRLLPERMTEARVLGQLMCEQLQPATDTEV